MNPPKRRFFITLTHGADSLDDLASALRHIAFQIQSESSSGRVTSGGPSDGGHYDLVEDPEMTHERYFEEVNKFLAEKDNGAAEEVPTPRAALTPPGHVLVGPDARERIARALCPHGLPLESMSEWARERYYRDAGAVLVALGVRGGA